ncbi:hypothetical protein CNX70_25265 [Janthinobacterium svalbardensis]|uniref:Uncharacterized protein n=1 Tax=Janthinobacterium svalbardensis TaxID=368607 RepID=A0A290X1S8_9BURK|nr:hypothetical protein CNX70_25265 [Janthinobacterium svalbardensis]
MNKMTFWLAWHGHRFQKICQEMIIAIKQLNIQLSNPQEIKKTLTTGICSRSIHAYNACA